MFKEKKTLKLSIIASIAVAGVLSASMFVNHETAYAGNVKLANAKVFIAGDSIQNPNNSYLKSLGAGPVIQQTCQMMKVKGFKNVADAGATLTTTYEKNIYKQIAKEYKSGTLGNYNYYFIAGGINDSKFDVSFGSAKSTNTNEVCGALNKSIVLIKTAYAKKNNNKTPKIILVSPMYTSNNWMNKQAKDYYKNMVNVSKNYNFVKVVQGYNLASLANMKNKANSADGLHPKTAFIKNTVAKNLVTELNKLTF